MSDTPERPPLEADATPIGRDWVEYAKALEARVKEQEEALRHIADWTYEPHNISVQEFARRALSADTEAPKR